MAGYEMSEEHAAWLKANLATEEWFTTCPKCGKELVGTLEEISKHTHEETNGKPSDNS